MEEMERRKKKESKATEYFMLSRILTHGTLRSFLVRINSEATPNYKAKPAEAVSTGSFTKGEHGLAYKLVFFSLMCQIQDA